MATLIGYVNDHPLIQLDCGEVYAVEASLQPADPSVGIMDGYVDDMEFYTTDGVHVELYCHLTNPEYEQIKQLVWDAIEKAESGYDDYYVTSGEIDEQQHGRMLSVINFWS